MENKKYEYYGPLWDWKAMMHDKCDEGPENMDGISSCYLPGGVFIHRGRFCDGCRYNGPRNLY
ncbi:hypothetical protein E4H12_13235 [Candidatus Thorarchaeota archaeon]|nr:MAG: hypothetical protein E4H12_13235 [Candidatus Thorarchaeota archaeon]